MEIIEQINLIEAVLLAGILLVVIIFDFMITLRVRAVERLLIDQNKILALKENQNIIGMRVGTLQPKEADAHEIEELDAVKILPVQETLAKIIPRQTTKPEPTGQVQKEPIETCEWCGNDYKNLNVHKRFCKSKPKE